MDEQTMDEQTTLTRDEIGFDVGDRVRHPFRAWTPHVVTVAAIVEDAAMKSGWCVVPVETMAGGQMQPGLDAGSCRKEGA